MYKRQIRALVVRKEFKAPKVNLVLGARKEYRESLDRLGLMVRRGSKVIREILEQMVFKDLKVIQEQRALKDRQVLKDPQVLKDLQVLKALQGLMGQQEHKVLREIQVLRAVG